MLHELVFVLLGYPGDIFVPYPPTEPSTFAIPTDFPLLHTTERECLNRLGQLGWIYLQINSFLSTTKDIKRNDTSRPHGAYVQALVTSLDQSLNDYRNDILDMEKRILSKEDEAGGGIVPLSLLVANLNRWQLLLPALWQFVRRLTQDPERYHGCGLFDLLLDQSRTGIYELRAEIEKMTIQLHDVLYRQLTAWMVYGQWVDPDHEFFIVPYTEDKDVTAWNRLYVVDYNRVPAHLPRSLVDSILFVGKAIATVNEMNKLPVSIIRHEDDSLLPFQAGRQQQQAIVIPTEMRKQHLELLLSLHSSQQNQQSVWTQYPRQLQTVVNRIRKSTADWLFTQVLVGEHGLHRYLQSFRNVFLLSFGDFTTNFIDECVAWRRRSLHAEHRGRTSSRSKTAILFRYQEINALLTKASLTTEAEDQLEGFSLLVDDEKLQQYSFSDLLLFDLRMILTFDLKWPIDLFLHKSDLKIYSYIWSFLISIKSTQMALNNLWKALRIHNSEESHTSSQYEGNEGYYERRVWRLRSSMLYWIDIVWNHLQSNVIDVHYRQLIDTITLSSDSAVPSHNNKRRSWNANKKIDFEEIQTAHGQFLDNLMRGCLLKSSECVNTMRDILKTCLDFCDLMEKLSEDGEWRRHKRRKTAVKTATEIVNQWIKSDDLSWMDDVNKKQETFNSLMERFFALASSQQPEVKSSGQIDVLLMQLDYNKWYSVLA